MHESCEIRVQVPYFLDIKFTHVSIKMDVQFRDNIS
jgi:hypothetical protein